MRPETGAHSERDTEIPAPYLPIPRANYDNFSFADPFWYVEYNFLSGGLLKVGPCQIKSARSVRPGPF